MLGSIIGGLFCMIGGFLLCLIEVPESQGLLGSISYGIGIYCIGNGIYVIFQGMQFNEIKKMARRDRDKENWEKLFESIQSNGKIGSVVDRIYQRYCISGSVRGIKKGGIEELS